MLATAVGVVSAVMSKNASATEEAAKAQADLNASFVAGAGGAEALTAALTKDNEAGATVTGTHQQLTQTFNDNHDGTASLTTAWQVLDSTGRVLSSTIDHSRDATVAYADSQVSAANAAKGAGVQQDALGHKVGLTTDELTRQNVVIGDNTKALELQAIQSQIQGDSKGKNASGSDALLQSGDIAAAFGRRVSTSATCMPPVSLVVRKRRPPHWSRSPSCSPRTWLLNRPSSMLPGQKWARRSLITETRAGHPSKLSLMTRHRSTPPRK